jgi:uncharacterized membrane protein YraQ (UPF0718 family)
LSLAPYVIAGSVVGEYLKTTSWIRLLHTGVNRRPVISVVAASLIGAVSPLCTYGTVPVVLALYRTGVALPPLISFLAVSSMMNPQLFIVTWGGVGPEMAIARLISVVVFGVALGLVMYKVPVWWAANSAISRTPDEESCAASHSDVGANRSVSCMSRSGSLTRSGARGLALNILRNLEFVGVYFVIGVIVGSAVEEFVPREWVVSALGQDRTLSVLLAAVMGIPLYACGGASIPVIRLRIDQGMTRSAALAYFIVGPATRVTPLMALLAVLRPGFLIAYVAAFVAFACLIGLVSVGYAVHTLGILARPADLVASAEAPILSAANRPSSSPNARVAVVQCSAGSAYDISYEEVESMVREAIALAGGLESVVNDGDVVVLKPNLVGLSDLAGLSDLGHPISQALAQANTM